MNRSFLLLPAALVLLAGLFGAVIAGEAEEKTYDQRAAALRVDDADGHYRLALWCEQNDLKAYALRQYRMVVTIEPDHRAARRALGYERIRGRWVKGEEAMRAKGFVEHEGVWVTPEEYKLLAKDEIRVKRAREARRIGDEALKQAWSKDPAVRSRAMATIERIDQEFRLRPLAIAARINRPDVRMRAVKGLGALNDADALPPLYKRSIFDADETIRGAAVDAIRQTEAEGKIGPFVRALNSAFAPVRLHAVKALGALGDAAAVGPLIARYQIAGGSGQSVYFSQTNNIAFVQDFDVEVAQTAFIADPVIGVIQDGFVLNFRALATSGYVDVYEKVAINEALHKLTGQERESARDWAKWYRESKAKQ
jgi:hypothetical protein